MSIDTINETIICICTLVTAWQSFKSRIPSHSQCNPVFWSQLLQFSQYTRCYARYCCSENRRVNSILADNTIASCSLLAYRQSIIPCTNSILFCRLKLMKLVSTNTLYGGPSAVLCWKKSEEGAVVILLTAFSSAAFFLAASLT